MEVSPALLVDRVVQTRQDQTVQAAQFQVMKKAMDLNESASAASLNAVPAPLPLATEGPIGTHVNALV